MVLETIKPNRFAWHSGDHAGYAFGDVGAALRLARAGTVSVDIETRGLGTKAYSVTAVSVGNSAGAYVFDPLRHQEAIRDILSVARCLCFHNSPFDVPVMVATGLMRLADVDKVVDTLTVARLINPDQKSSKSLAACCTDYLGSEYGMWKTSLEENFRYGTSMTKSQMFEKLGIESPAFIAYAAFDVVMTARLLDELPTKLTLYGGHDPMRVLRREATVNRMLLKRSARGILVDLGVVDEMRTEMMATTARIDTELERWGVDVSGTRAGIREAVVDKLDEMGVLGPRHPRLANGRPSANQQYLGTLKHPLNDLLVERNRAERFRTDYAETVVGLAGFDGRIHPQVNILAATTGRMSVSTPALQQFPPVVRRMLDFERPVTSLDWSSIEPVFAAGAFQDSAVITEFEAGNDLYQPVADAAGVSRKEAKVVLLASLYGEGIPALSNQLGTSEDEAREVQSKVMDRMPGIRDGIKLIRRMGDTLGWIATVSGRKLPLEIDFRGTDRWGAKRYKGYKGVNYFVQGSCLDLLSEALYEAHRRGLDDALEFAVHDELVVATEAADEFDEIMRTPPADFVEMAGRTPVLRTGRVDLGTHWNAKEA